jgi:hypothetical protein
MILYSTIERLIDYDIAVPGRCVVPMKMTTINLTSCHPMNMLPREVGRAETSRTGNVIASERPFLGEIRRWIQGHIDLRKQRPQATHRYPCRLAC